MVTGEAPRAATTKGVPDYSPRMLAMFLAGRDVAGTLVAARRAAGVPARVFVKACEGMLKAGGSRARLWAALGVFPADHGVVLTDKGGQEPASSFDDIAAPAADDERARAISELIRAAGMMG